MSNFPSFGEQLKAKRKSLRLTQKDVAERLGITPQAYAKYEKAPYAPRAITVSKLAKALDMEPDELLLNWKSPNMFVQEDPEFDLYIEHTIQKLSTDGKNRLLQYAKDLLGNPRFRKEEPEDA